MSAAWALVAAEMVAPVGRVRMRAREHYETIDVTQGGQTTRFRGFTNSISLHYEVPYHYAVGFVGSPLLATLMANDPPDGFDDRIRLVHLGLEGKAFPAAASAHAFVRGGVYAASMNPRGSAGVQQGKSALAGVGYEFDLGGIGLAPEFSWRWGVLSGGTRFAGSAPCIGLHFYSAI